MSSRHLSNTHVSSIHVPRALPGDVQWRTMDRRKGDQMWRTWNSLKGRPASMLPEQSRKQLEEARNALEEEYRNHSEDLMTAQAEVKRANEHARVANIKREEVQNALSAAEAQVSSMRRELELMQVKMADKTRMEMLLVQYEERVQAMSINHHQEMERAKNEIARMEGLTAKLYSKVNLGFASKCNKIFRGMRHGELGEVFSDWQSRAAMSRSQGAEGQIATLQKQLHNSNEEVRALHQLLTKREDERKEYQSTQAVAQARIERLEAQLKALQDEVGSRPAAPSSDVLQEAINARRIVEGRLDQMKQQRDDALLAKERVLQEAGKLRHHTDELEGELRRARGPGAQNSYAPLRASASNFDAVMHDSEWISPQWRN